MSKNTQLPSAIAVLAVFVFVVLFQRKQNRTTHLLLQQYRERLELVESQMEQLKPEKLPTGYLAALKSKVQRLSKSQLILETTLPAQVAGFKQSLADVENQTAVLEEQLKQLAKQQTPLETSTTPAPQPLPPGEMGRVALFIDAANIEIAARKQGLKFNYRELKQELTKEASELVGTFFYTAVDERNRKQVYFLRRLEAKGYQIIKKKLIRHPDGTVEGNLDSEIIRDLMKLSETYDIAVLASADGDFKCIVEELQQKGKRVQVVSFPPVNKELEQVADRFIDITTLPVFADKVNSVKSLPTCRIADAA